MSDVFKNIAKIAETFIRLLVALMKLNSVFFIRIRKFSLLFICLQVRPDLFRRRKEGQPKLRHVVQQKVIEKQRQIRDTWHTLVRQIKEQPPGGSAADTEMTAEKNLNENQLVTVSSPNVDLSPKTDIERALGSTQGSSGRSPIVKSSSPNAKKKCYKAMWRRIVEQKVLTNRSRDDLPDYSLPADSEMLEIRRSANSSPIIVPETLSSAGTSRDPDVEIELTSDFISVHVQSKVEPLQSAEENSNPERTPKIGQSNDAASRNGDVISPAFLSKYMVIDMNDTAVSLKKILMN